MSKAEVERQLAEELGKAIQKHKLGRQVWQFAIRDPHVSSILIKSQYSRIDKKERDEIFIRVHGEHRTTQVASNTGRRPLATA
jgi:hypothetical protein